MTMQVNDLPLPWWHHMSKQVAPDRWGVVKGETEIFWLDDYDIIRDREMRCMYWMEGGRVLMHYTIEKVGDY